MRTTVTLDDDVFEAARAQAQASGKKLGEVLSQLARRGLRASTPDVGKDGLPVFKVRPDADIIPSSRAKQMLAEDPSIYARALGHQQVNDAWLVEVARRNDGRVVTLDTRLPVHSPEAGMIEVITT